MIFFWGLDSDTLTTRSAWIPIVEIIRHEPYRARTCVLQGIWNVARMRHMVVSQVEPDDPEPRLLVSICMVHNTIIRISL